MEGGEGLGGGVRPCKGPVDGVGTGWVRGERRPVRLK